MTSLFLSSDRLRSTEYLVHSYPSVVWTGDRYFIAALTPRATEGYSIFRVFCSALSNVICRVIARKR